MRPLEFQEFHTACRQRSARQKLIGFQRFVVDFVEGRNPVVPFQQRRGWPARWMARS